MKKLASIRAMEGRHDVEGLIDAFSDEDEMVRMVAADVLNALTFNDPDYRVKRMASISHARVAEPMWRRRRA